jgi:shikimate kinase
MINIHRNNIVLIGMPSAGKSTIGEGLANKTGMLFLDTDIVIKEKQNKALKDIVNTEGLARFLEIQENAILELDLEKTIIATGGSVVYGNAAMVHLKKNSVVVYLKLDFKSIEERVTPERRFARSTEQSLWDLYNERVPLYEKYCDVIIDCAHKNVEEIVQEILGKVKFKGGVLL